MPGTDWRSFVAGKFNDAVAAGNRGAALQALGQGLHALQDAYAHDLAGAGMWAHIFGEVNPDDPDAEANRARVSAATAATTNAIRDWVSAGVT